MWMVRWWWRIFGPEARSWSRRALWWSPGRRDIRTTPRRLETLWDTVERLSCIWDSQQSLISLCRYYHSNIHLWDDSCHLKFPEFWVQRSQRRLSLRIGEEETKNKRRLKINVWRFFSLISCVSMILLFYYIHFEMIFVLYFCADYVLI